LGFSFSAAFSLAPWAKHSRNLRKAWFLVVLPVLRFAASATGSAQLHTQKEKAAK
jgi:hypothetical protein